MTEKKTLEDFLYATEEVELWNDPEYVNAFITFLKAVDTCNESQSSNYLEE